MIEAAGGLLWKKGPGTSMQIALVHRHRYGDWTLPKGKLQAGESHLQGALREVREETGYQATVIGFAGAIAYETSSGPKLVRFWNMIPEMEARLPFDKSEVTETVWLEPAVACLKMDYPLERAIVEAYMGDLLQTDQEDQDKQVVQLPGLCQKLRLWWTLKDIAYENLALQLPLFHKEFLGLCRELSTKKAEKDAEKGTEVSGVWELRV
jgi:8-oxo-dGTP diphosphatase